MGNDNEIKKDIIETAKSKFLPKEIPDDQSSTLLYSLDDEFEKSKKNKNIILYLFILIFLTVIIIFTVIFTKYLDEKNKKVSINISEFDDLRLKDVLDAAKEKENNADVLSIQLEILEIKMFNAMLDVRKRYHERELNVVKEDLSDYETETRIGKIRVEESKAIKRVRWKFAGFMRTKRAAIAIARQKKREEIKKLKDEETVSNEEKLFDLRNKKIKESQKEGKRILKNYLNRYTKFIRLKYNPNFRSSELRKIVASTEFKDTEQRAKIRKTYLDIVTSNRDYSRREFNTLKKKIVNQNHLIKRLTKVPYFNSVFPALQQLDFLSKSIIYDYETQIRKRDRELDNFKYAFDYILDKKPESGYIIDARNMGNIKFHLFRSLRIKAGNTAMIFRKEDQYIGKIEFIQKPYGIRAKQIEKVSNQKIRPMDKILLQVKEK